MYQTGYKVLMRVVGRVCVVRCFLLRLRLFGLINVLCEGSSDLQPGLLFTLRRF